MVYRKKYVPYNARMKGKLAALAGAMATKLGSRDKNFKKGFTGAIKNKWADTMTKHQAQVAKRKQREHGTQ